MGALIEGLSRVFLRPAPAADGAPDWPAPAADARTPAGCALPGDAPGGAPARAFAPLAPPGAAPLRIAVLCGEKDGAVAGGAAGVAVATVSRCGWALLAEWGAGEEEARPDRLAARAAHRAADALRRQGHLARASGRLVHVGLPADGAESAARIARLSVTTAPMVILSAGPRDGVFEDVLAGTDRLLLATRTGLDADLLALAQAELAALHPDVATVELPASPAAAALARSGTALVAPLRAPFLAAVRPSKVGQAEPFAGPQSATT